MLIFPTLYSSPHDRGIKYACLSTPSAESTPKKKRQRPGREASSSEGRSGRRRTRKKEEGKTLIGNQCPSGLWNIHYSFFPARSFSFPLSQPSLARSHLRVNGLLYASSSPRSPPFPPPFGTAPKTSLSFFSSLLSLTESGKNVSTFFLLGQEERGKCGLPLWVLRFYSQRKPFRVCAK